MKAVHTLFARRRFAALGAVLLMLACLAAPAGPALTAQPEPESARAADMAVYADALAAGWQDWSWSTTRNFAATAQVHGGAKALAVTFTAGWAGLSLRAPSDLPAGDYTALDFWAYGGAGGSPVGLGIQPTSSGDPPLVKQLNFPAGTWTHYNIPLSELGGPATIARLTWQERTGTAQATFYLDDIRLVGAPPAALALSVDAAADVHAISPNIYGMNEYGSSGAFAAFMDEIDLPVRRWGGNATSRYNYQNDISNHAFDWYFANLKESDATNLPADSAVNRFIDENFAAGSQSFLVTPMSGYVARNAPLACGFSVAKYGAQQSTAAGDGRPDCGNGVWTNGNPVTSNDPLDTSLAITPAFVTGWVSYLAGRYGTAANGGVRYYNLDNEPDLWWETHRDVAPTGLTYDQLRDRTLAYAAAIKAGDPGAQVLGPATGIWPYYFVSPYDGQRGDWATPDDTNAHDGVALTAWYLQQLKAHDDAHNQRLLDYLDLHYYPQGGVALTTAGDAARQALRLRSTRSLWDPTYVDESWIAQAGPDGGIVKLIPRMRAWVNANYPGTKLAVGEYNWGGQEHINGALAQADVLGIFGREALDLATLWAPPAPDEPGAYAFRMYRNYNGSGGKFGDQSVRAASSDQGRLSIYAARRTSDGALTVLVINKTGEALAAPLALANFAPGGTAQVYRYSAANLNAIVRLADQAVGAQSLELSAPANSMTLYVIPAGGGWWRTYLPVTLRH